MTDNHQPRRVDNGGTIPEVIYLQWHGDEPVTRLDEDDNEVPIPEDEMPEVDPTSGEVTWCDEKIYDGDIAYLRASTVRRVATEAAEALSAFRVLYEDHGECAPTPEYTALGIAQGRLERIVEGEL